MTNEEVKDEVNFKTLIAVMSSHDSPEGNMALRDFLNKIYDEEKVKSEDNKILKKFGFLFTGGTHGRVIKGVLDRGIYGVREEVKEFFKDKSLILPEFGKGGNTALTFLIAQKQISMIWSFYPSLTSHVLSPENNVLMRLCDQWSVKRFMNEKSIETWLKKEALQFDAKRNLRPFPPEIILRRDGGVKHRESVVANKNNEGFWEFSIPTTNEINDSIFNQRIALIAFNKQKERLVEFARNYERELSAFKQILTTSVSGNRLQDAVPGLSEKIYRYHSGLEGGFIEIATEAIIGKLRAIVLLTDPTDSTSYLDETKVLLGSTMINDRVTLITNEEHAREWIEHIIRPEILSCIKKKYSTGDYCPVTGTYIADEHDECTSDSDNQDSSRVKAFTQGDRFPTCPKCNQIQIYWRYDKS